MTIGNEYHRETQCQGAARRGVNTVLGLKPANDQTVNFTLLEEAREPCSEKRVRSGLGKHHVLWLDDKRRCELPPMRTLLEQTFLRLMLNEYHRHICAARSVRDGVDARDNLFDLKSLVLALAKRLLNINDE